MATTYDELAAAEQPKQQQHKYCLCVCMAAGCISQRSDAVKEALQEEVEAQGLGGEVRVKGVGCMGLCTVGPLVSVEPSGVLYQKITIEDAPAVVKSLREKSSQPPSATD